MDDQYKDLCDEYANKDRSYYENERAELLPFIPNNIKTVLDVGCGTGSFGAMLKRHRPGIEVWGIEPDEESAKTAASRLDKVINGVFHKTLPELKNQRFDLITFNDVLEHLVNPEDALAVSKRFLSEKGTVAASIPNVLYFYHLYKVIKDQDWKYEEAGIIDRTHLRFFTKKSIVRLLEDQGFKIEFIKGINASYGLKFNVVNLLSFGRFNDFKYVQFVVVARQAI